VPALPNSFPGSVSTSFFVLGPYVNYSQQVDYRSARPATSVRDGRSLIYRVDPDGTRLLLAFLLEDCCPKTARTLQFCHRERRLELPRVIR
jgi:hypothetical protein